MSFVDFGMIWFILLPPSLLIWITVWAVRKQAKNIGLAHKAQVDRLARYQVAQPVKELDSRSDLPVVNTTVSPDYAEESWVANQNGYLDVRSLYANLCYEGKEWDTTRKEILVGIGVAGFEILGPNDFFTGYVGAVDRIGFWTEPEGGEACFWLDKPGGVMLESSDRLEITGSSPYPAPIPKPSTRRQSQKVLYPEQY